MRTPLVLLLLWRAVIMAAEPVRYALVLTGAVSRLKHEKRSSARPAAALYVDPQKYAYTPLRVTSAGHRRHVLLANNATFDVFVHSWSHDLRANFSETYGAIGTGHYEAVFEDAVEVETTYQQIFRAQGKKSDWRQVSWSFSMSRAALMVLNHVRLRRLGSAYERVVITRPDVVLTKDLRLDELSTSADRIYVNQHPGANGDFHFVLSDPAHLRFFATLPFKAFTFGATMHGWIKNAANASGLHFKMDQIAPGHDEEVFRKCYGLNRAGEVAGAAKRLLETPGNYNMASADIAWVESTG